MLNTKRPIAERRLQTIGNLARSVQSEQGQPANNPVIEASGPAAGTTTAGQPMRQRYRHADDAAGCRRR